MSLITLFILFIIAAFIILARTIKRYKKNSSASDQRLMDFYSEMNTSSIPH